jgi:hypothetical protein
VKTGSEIDHSGENSMRKTSITLVTAVAIVLVVAVLWLTNRAVTPVESTWDDVATEAVAGGYKLITTKELAELYGQDPTLLLVDTRQDWEYRAGHIEGALLFPMEPTAWARWTKKDDLAAFLGPDKRRTIVFY